VTSPGRLLPWSLFAAMIAAAGLPIYIHAPKFYVDAYGVSLSSLGLVLGLLRLIDVVQDPALGWLAERSRQHRGAMVAGAVALMAMSMVALLAVPPPVTPLAWFAVTLVVLFSAFSFLTICFYAQGVAFAATLGPKGHLRLAGWREAGALIGVSLAAVAPVALGGLSGSPFAAFAWGFAAFALIAALAMRGRWGAAPLARMPRFGPVLRDPGAQRLLVLSLVNAAPVAVTSTLFLFFVESRLAAPGWEGPLLLLFFLAAAVSAPAWSRLAAQYGAKPVLLAGMTLAILAFVFATGLGAGDTAAFAAICAASGAALGADMVLLPAIFARHLARSLAGAEALAFGLWSFASKLALALAAVTLLPLLDAGGFVAGPDNTGAALWLLTALYTGLPCALKLVAVAMLLATPVPEG
jgi:GPH family glycoside/pentoside/hexuronide:cation symporter